MRTAVVVAVLVGVVGIAWRVEAGDGKAVEDRVASLEESVARLEKRVATLEEKRPATPEYLPGMSPSDKMRFTIKLDVDSFKQGIDLYRLENRTLPASLKDLIVPSKKSNEPFIEGSSVPLDPWGQDYDYHVTNLRKGEYTITSWGPDKQAGTADDVVYNSASGFK